MQESVNHPSNIYSATKMISHGINDYLYPACTHTHAIFSNIVIDSMGTLDIQDDFSSVNITGKGNEIISGCEDLIFCVIRSRAMKARFSGIFSTFPCSPLNGSNCFFP